MNKIGTCVMALLLAVFLFYDRGAEAVEDKETPASDELVEVSQTTSEADEAEGSDSPEPMPQSLTGLRIEDFIKMVVEKNEKIIAQQLEMEISREKVESARSIFEPAFVSSYMHEEVDQKYSQEEKARLLYAFDERNDRTNQYYGAVGGMIPTGGSISLGYTLVDTADNFNKNTGDEYETVLGVNVAQPLLKNGGIEATMANIRMAEADSDVALQTYRRQMMNVVLEAAETFWDLFLAQEIHRLRQGSVNIAEQMLKDNREKVRFGKMAKTEILEAEAGLAERVSMEIVAKQDVVAMKGMLRTYVSSSDIDKTIEIEVDDSVRSQPLAPIFDESLGRALKLRPDYTSALKKLDREKIRVAFAENQRWPQLDLKGSYGLNGLDNSTGTSWDDAMDGDYENWSVGFEFRIPLMGDRKSRSELAAAKRMKRQALLETKAVEVNAANGVHIAVENVFSTYRQVKQHVSVVDLKQRLLDVEFMRLDAGKSNSKWVLEREEELHDAKDDLARSVVRNKKAELYLKMEEGSLLRDFGVDVVEGDA